MEYYNDSSNMTNASGDNYSAERIPLFATYFNMALILMMVAIIIIPAGMVVRIIRKTKELRTKYYFFVVNLLVTNIIDILIEGILQYAIIILIQLGLESGSTENTLKKFILPLHMTVQLTSTLLLIPLAFDCAGLIALSFRYTHYFTDKTVDGMIAAVWVVSAALTVIITIVVPVQIVWALAIINFSDEIIPFILVAMLTMAVFIIVTSAYLFYKVTELKRKARKNKTLENEEQATRFAKLVQLFCSQSKAIIALTIIGEVDVLAKILVCIAYVAINNLALAYICKSS